MASAGHKRGRDEDEPDRRSLGAAVKKLRAVVDQSLENIARAPLADWDRTITKWESNVEDIRASGLAVGSSLKEIANIISF